MPSVNGFTPNRNLEHLRPPTKMEVNRIPPVRYATSLPSLLSHPTTCSEPCLPWLCVCVLLEKAVKLIGSWLEARVTPKRQVLECRVTKLDSEFRSRSEEFPCGRGCLFQMDDSMVTHFTFSLSLYHPQCCIIYTHF